MRHSHPLPEGKYVVTLVIHVESTVFNHSITGAIAPSESIQQPRKMSIFLSVYFVEYEGILSIKHVTPDARLKAKSVLTSGLASALAQEVLSQTLLGHGGGLGVSSGRPLPVKASCHRRKLKEVTGENDLHPSHYCRGSSRVLGDTIQQLTPKRDITS